MEDNTHKYLIDLDGTIYRDNSPISFAKEFIERLYENGRDFLIVTNVIRKTHSQN